MRITDIARALWRPAHLSLALVACATTQPGPSPSPERATVANARDVRAQPPAPAWAGQKELREYRCGEQVPGESVLAIPCWNPADDDRAEARLPRQRRAAAVEARVGAAPRIVTELAPALAACRDIPAPELGHSPFAHRSAITDVGEHYVGSAMRGARITFRRIPGLSEEFLRQAIACNQARFDALGESPMYLPADPTVVPGAKIVVTGDQATISVCIEVATDEAAQTVIGRARALFAVPIMAVR